MDTREITIRVDAEAAKSYTAASAEEQKKMGLLLSLRLSQLTKPSDSLGQIMRETSGSARARGLTERELDGMLNGGRSASFADASTHPLQRKIP